MEAGGEQMPDVRRRIALATSRFGKLRHIWHDGDLHINFRMRRVCVVCVQRSHIWLGGMEYHGRRGVCAQWGQRTYGEGEFDHG